MGFATPFLDCVLVQLSTPDRIVRWSIVRSATVLFVVVMVLAIIILVHVVAIMDSSQIIVRRGNAQLLEKRSVPAAVLVILLQECARVRRDLVVSPVVWDRDR